MDARLWQEVSGELLAHELVEADVVIEGADEVVAVFVRAFGGIVPFVAIRVRVAHDVHPVAGEVFAEVGAGEERLGEGLE